MFSAVAENERKTIIDNCLKPLLRLAEDGYKFGLQISVVSLEIIHSIDKSILPKIIKLVDDGRIEIIGNGYSQIIQPLIPWEVNLKNQMLGIDGYLEMLKTAPKIATINEMAFSSESTRSYADAGYETILMEWNNAYKNNQSWNKNYKYFLAKICFHNSQRIKVMWGDSIAFQKFQRYVHGEISLEKYISWLEKSTRNAPKSSSLCLYCSDAEVFDFRPRRYGTESASALNEWHRIKLLFEWLDKNNFEVDLPSSSVTKDQNYSPNNISISNHINPIVVKKQEKYNINRWSITGRDDFNLNTSCYRIYNNLGNNSSNDKWKQLIFLWSSDLRTHIEIERWNKAKKILKSLDKKSKNSDKITFNKNTKSVKLKHSSDEKDLDLCLGSNKLILDTRKGLSLRSWSCNGKKYLGTIEHGYFDDISFAADFYSGISVLEPLGSRKITDLRVINNFEVGDESVSAKFVNQETLFRKEFKILEDNSFEITQQINLPSRSKMKISNCIFTFFPQNWDVNSLYFSSILGGNTPERFKIVSDINHSENLNFNVGSKGGFSATDGSIDIGDQNKSINFRFNPSSCFFMPKIYFHKVDNNNFLLRLAFLSQDVDETFQEDDKPTEFLSRIKVTLQDK